MDQTNISLFCRKSSRWTSSIKLPTSKGPNVHVICAVSSFQMSYNARQWWAFKYNAAKASLLEMLERLPAGILVDSVVIVCDNVPWHSKLEEYITQHPGLNVCRLRSYSPMLNPVKIIWSKMKAFVEQHRRVLPVQPLVWENSDWHTLKDWSMRPWLKFPQGNIMRAWQHAHGFFQNILNMEDVKLGA